MRSSVVLFLASYLLASCCAASVSLGSASLDITAGSVFQFSSNQWQTTVEIKTDSTVQQVTVDLSVENLDTTTYDIPDISEVFQNSGSSFTLVPASSKGDEVQSSNSQRLGWNLSCVSLIAIVMTLLVGQRGGSTFTRASLSVGFVVLICGFGMVSSGSSPTYHVVIRVPADLVLDYDVSLAVPSSAITLHDVTVNNLKLKLCGADATSLSLTRVTVNGLLNTCSVDLSADSITLGNSASVDVVAMDVATFSANDFAGTYSIRSNASSVSFSGDSCTDDVVSNGFRTGVCSPAADSHNNTFSLVAQNQASVCFGSTCTVAPTSSPTSTPTKAPTQPPTDAPTSSPTKPTKAPTQPPTDAPTQGPTKKPTKAPTQPPTDAPTTAPTTSPTQSPTKKPTQAPTTAPTTSPTQVPTTPPNQPNSTFGTPSSTPMILYTDIVSGPVSGGENGLGCYLSIFGTGFGPLSGIGTTTKVYIDNVEVANYRYYGNAAVVNKQGIAQLTVQVGNLAGLTLGTSYAIKVVVNGVASNTDNKFIPNPGKIYFASLTGSDTTGAANNINKPYRTLQTPDGGGIHAVLRAGDHIVVRGGEWSDVGLDTCWFRFRWPDQQGSKPTGASGTGWIHFTAYPGASVNTTNAIEYIHFKPTTGNKGGIMGCNNDYFSTTGDWVSVSNLHLEVDPDSPSDASPINIQYSLGPWRAVNNELGPWLATGHTLAGGVSGANCQNCFVLGNYIHDFHCVGALENHGVYVDSGASHWEVAYNWIENIPGGNGIQFYDSKGLAGTCQANMFCPWPGYTGFKVHNNWFENCGKYMFNLADGSQEIAIYNNVAIGATYAPVRFNTFNNLSITISFNTFYDNDLVSQAVDGQVITTWGGKNNGSVVISNNIFAAGPNTLANGGWYGNYIGNDLFVTFFNNLWYNGGHTSWGQFSRDSLASYGNPKFTDAANHDLSLTSTSPALDKGTYPTPFVVSNDFTHVISRPQGSANDLGSFERKV